MSRHFTFNFISAQKSMLEFPDLEIPNLEPYRPSESWTMAGVAPLNYDIQTSEMKIDGFKNLVVKELRCVVYFHHQIFHKFKKVRTLNAILYSSAVASHQLPRVPRSQQNFTFQR